MSVGTYIIFRPSAVFLLSPDKRRVIKHRAGHNRFLPNPFQFVTPATVQPQILKLPLHPVQHTHILQVRICRQTLTTHTTTCTIEPLSVTPVKYSLPLPDGESCVIRNILEQFLEYFKNILNSN
jgi:hypothetical protein